MTGESDATTRKNDSNPPLKSLGKYLIERKLGQGGMGTVYLAKHTDLKKLIALKVLPQDKAKNPILVRRFKAEAQAAGQLEHPNIVSVYDTGEINGHLFIAMEYVDGIDLFEYLRKHKVVPVKRSIEIVKEVASALQHAYEQNIVHRDIKPSNLLVRRDGTVKITDLGLARSIDDTLETNITRAGTTVGTVDYMAPEQARNSKSADIRSDIYSLGCTWYQMLTGLPPYPDGSMTNKLHAHSTKPLPDPRVQNENIPEGVFAILQRMTAKKPEDRYQTPADLLEDINHSKLTKAAFSNEILSDLTDDDESGIQSPVFDDEEVVDSKRAKSRVEDEGDVDVVPPGSTRIERGRSTDSQNDLANPARPRSKLPVKSRPEEVDGTSSPRKPNAAGTADKRAGKNAPKALPPKRQPLVAETAPAPLVNLELIKQIAIATALCAVAIGIGWFVFQWSSQFDSANPPVAQAPAGPPEAVPVPHKPPEKPEVVTTQQVVQPVVAFDIVKQTPPAWATANPGEPKDLPVFAVGPGAMDGVHLPNLNEALQAADKTGGHIKLLGNGPFVMSSFELVNAKRIVITPGLEEDRPLIIVRPASTDSVAGIALKNGELDLRGLHFLLDRSSNPAETLKSIVSVTDGQLLVRNCSFTATGSDAVPAAAVAFNSVQDFQNSPAIEPRLLFDRVVIRGNGLTGVSLHRANADVQIVDSLIATGTAPAVNLNGHLVPGLADAVTPKPRRIIRFVRSILCARKHVLDLGVESTEKPPTTDILFQDSICSTEGSGNSSVLAHALQWPSVSTRAGSWLTNLNWTSVSSLYLGFEQWLESKSQFKVTGIEDWERVWNKKYDASQFQSIFWQESPFVDLSLVVPSDFDSAKLPYRDVKTAGGGLPGCAIENLRVPAEISQSRLFATSQRPKLPAIVNGAADSPPIRIDLAKEDLGLFLNRNEWPTGAVLEVTGSGFKNITPVKIVNKSVRIIFRQGDGPALRIHPKNADLKSKHDTAAMFSIENGTLELHSMALEIPTSARNFNLPWMISAKNANLVLKDCQVRGPQSYETESYQGLIHWVTTNGSPSSNGDDIPFIAIHDSLLLSMANGIEANCVGGNLFLRNSIIATRGNALNVVTTTLQNPRLPIVDLEHVTFAALKSAIRIDIPDDKLEVVSPPIRLFVDFCAVMPPPEFKEGSAHEPAFVECSNRLLEQKRIEWWGNSNGVAKDVPILIRRTDGEPITNTTNWQAAWGDTNDVRLLTGPKGVQLASTTLGKWPSVKATSFQLDRDSAGATWADGARPVGADCRGLEESLLAKKSSKDSKSPTGKSNPSRSNPTKVNPGF